MNLKGTIGAVAACAVLLVGCGEKSNNDMAGPAGTMNNMVDSVSYSLGVSVGASLKSQGMEELNTDLVAQALKEAMAGEGKFDEGMANEIIGKYMQAKRDEKASEAKQAGIQFLEENAKNPDVTVTESGLQYMVITEGTGEKPGEEDVVRVHYHGTLIDGTVFDSSVDRGERAQFPVNGVIRGWVEALQMMPVGSKWKLFIPSELAYGDRQAGQKIGPGSTLIFEVELLEIVKP